MSSYNITETTPFSLETDDRTEDERARGKSAKNDRSSSGLGLGGSDKGPAPMDSDYQEEVPEDKPKIRFNLNFDKSINAATGNKGQKETRKFDMKRLFDAVTSGDMTQLDGLHQYLEENQKFLSDSLYQTNGKNALLKALLNLKNGRNDTVLYLLDIAERMGDLKKFVNAAHTDDYYKGQTALHIAIERRSSYFVQLLVQKGADVHAKACGKFFQVHEGVCFYFGELPLSLAACTNQLDIVDFLIDNPYQKVRITEKDSQGNMVLHALVTIADNTPENTEFVNKMYDEILTRAARVQPKAKLEDIENHQGLTPIKLAAKQGKFGIFTHMMQREFQEKETKHLSRKFTEWVYGPVHCSLYDLTSIDSYERNSVLEIIVYGSKILNRHEMLDVEPLHKLLEEKWNGYAKWMFHFNFFVYLAYLIIFTLVSYNRRAGTPPFPVEHSTKGYLEVSGHITSALGAVYFLYKAILDFKRKRPKLQTLLADGYCEILFFLQAVLFFISMVLYFCQKTEYVPVLVVCLALSWVNLLYFTRGYRSLGIYSVMIQKMIISDILRFLLVYVVFLFGFSAAVVTLLDDPGKNETESTKTSRFYFGPSEDKTGCKEPTFNGIAFTTLELFKFTIGMGDLEFTEKYQNRVVFYVLLISYIVLTYILLLNMLIALMNKTVDKMSQDSKSIWKLQRAITILDLERSLPHCLKDRLRSGVQKELGGKAGGDRRWCLRVEEVNWTKWNTDLGIINEDPGRYDVITPTSPTRGSTWHRTIRAFSRRGHRHQRRDHEMSSMATSPIYEGTPLSHMV
ncbi:hypothetical protein AGOR_G00021050 [Albula goreensis]|uniref:Ion transport domain-containing protein n=1 Tax=Albula goreensis TaxID=1534307 RepID=A0A8T3E7Y1_9TELE|nr:hypothetical protein AGOR_G00021050 [Albula goreensis]